MDISEALDIVVSRTGHARFRELCDPGHPDYDPAYVQYVLDRAGDPSPPRPRPQTSASPAIPLAGDLVAALTARVGADRAARWISGKLGTDCGCAARQAVLNRLDARLRRWLGLGPP